MTFFIRLIAISGVLILGACSHSDKAKKADLSRMIYSPNGEPLNGGPLGRPTCEEAMTGWMQRIAATGSMSRTAFMADANNQFDRMDIDHNGYLVSEELERYRLPYRQYVPPVAHTTHVSAESMPQSEKGRRRGNAGKKSDEQRSEQDTASDDIADPVMSADTNLDFKVTRAEYMAHAQSVFDRLDSNQDGALSRDEITAVCHPKPLP